MRWRLRLYCGHVIEKLAHRDHQSVEAAFGGQARCTECGSDPAVIIDAEPLGLVETPRTGGRLKRVTLKLDTRDQLAARISRLEGELSRLRAQLRDDK